MEEPQLSERARPARPTGMSTNVAPMAVTGVQHLIERAYRESGELQYLRELLVDALEAGALRVEFGPEWGAVEREGVWRRDLDAGAPLLPPC